MSQSNLQNLVFTMLEYLSCVALTAKRHEDGLITGEDIINLNQKYESLRNEYLLAKEIIKEEDKSLFIELEKRYEKLKTVLNILQEINNLK